MNVALIVFRQIEFDLDRERWKVCPEEVRSRTLIARASAPYPGSRFLSSEINKLIDKS